jgi:signal transduction histidine kinase
VIAERQPPPRPERVRTDESLRAERDNFDAELSDRASVLEKLTDAVIAKARMRADTILATARVRADQLSAPTLELARSRVREEVVLREERSDEDENLRADRATLRGHLSTLRRDTDEDLHEERSRADRAVDMRDEFLGVVSHDLRSMLAALMGSAAIIERAASQENGAEMIRVSAQRIERAAIRMTRLMGDLVDVASIEAGALAVNLELGDPTEVVMEVVDTFKAQAAAAEISLVAEVSSPRSLVRFDAARIFQVSTNLLSNALKFTPRRGHVAVRIERIDDDLRVAVRDTGVGMLADKLEAIFERFHQLALNDRRGVGLGLYISKCIVQEHGGRIWAESKLGEGSTFYFTLPIPRASS